MSVIRIGGFQGELPRIHPRLLPNSSAQVAVNCRIETGALDSIDETANVKATVLTDPISLHRYSATVWLEATTDVDWVPYPVANDQYGRLIFADPSAGSIRVTDGTSVGTGGYPSGYFRLDVPPPAQGFPALLQGTADDATEVPESRYYVCTFVNSWGAEGPPSPVSNEVEWRTGQTVLLSALPTVPTGNYNITHRRIYRINTGSTGATNFQYVTEVAVTQSQKAIASITQANPVVVTTTTAHGLTEGQEVAFAGLGSETAKDITGISKANPARVTVVNHGWSTGNYVELTNLGGINGMDELNDVRVQITLVDSDRFDLVGIDATGYVTYAAGGNAAQAHGMDELNANSFVTALVDTTSFSLLAVDGLLFKPYLDEGLVAQVAGVTYVDTIPSANLAEVIPTELYDPPNVAMKGLVVHPSGFLAGFYGNTLALSEPGAPHAWPINYRLVTSHPIVGLGVFGNTIAVMTKGWPYLAMGSDPAAISMVELEIDQACTAKRGIVDFGSAVAYPSPDGLIVMSNSGPTNASSGIFTRDQWQALVPTSFEAYNWEGQYLCFYDNGVVQRGFIIDPFDGAAGVRYVTKYVTGGFKDLEEDILYFIDDNQIEQWDQGTTKLPYTWKSKPTYTPHAVNMAAAKVIADSYPMTVEFFVDDVRRYTRLVTTVDAFKLPGGFRGEKFEVVLKGTRKVSEIIMATTMMEMAATV